MRLGVLALSVLFLQIAAVARPCPAGLQAYAGTFVPKAWSIEGYAVVGVREGVLTWGPPLWSPARILHQVAPDVFQMEDRPDRQFRFHRDAHGCVVSLDSFAFQGTLRRARPGEIPPLQRLLNGKAGSAFPALRQQASDDPKRLAELGERMLSLPSAISAAQTLARLLVGTYPDNSDVWLLLGKDQVASGEQKTAIASFRRALQLNPGNDDAARALAMLRGTSNSETGLSFPLPSVFAPATAQEISHVRSQWRAFDSSPRNVRLVREGQLELNGTRFHLRIVSHDVGSAQEYGVILVPANAAGKLPVIIEAKGVSPSFSPLAIPGGVNLVQVLGKDIGRFIIALPGYRGEEVIYQNDHWKSDSPHESWSGAADDLLSFLEVVLGTTPQADASRIGVFGRSRGGTVALLAAERDRRIRCVVAWAAPADWISLMSHEGWTLEQSVGDAVRHHAERKEREGQYVYNFLRYAIAGQEDLAAVRSRIIASSPLYFADSLPPTQLHYGVEDSIVPVRNGRSMVTRNPHVTALFYRDAGHDQDLFFAPRRSRAFLLRHLITGAPR